RPAVSVPQWVRRQPQRGGEAGPRQGDAERDTGQPALLPEAAVEEQAAGQEAARQAAQVAADGDPGDRDGEDQVDDQQADDPRGAKAYPGRSLTGDDGAQEAEDGPGGSHRQRAGAQQNDSQRSREERGHV